MKEISGKRIFRLYLATFIVLFFVANVLSNEARAETGNVTNTQTVSYDTEPTGNVAGGSTNFSRLLFDSANWDGITEFYISPNVNTSFLLNSNYTFFTIIGGGTGGGTASYNKYGNIILWSFDPGTVITGSPIEMRYESAIFDSNNLNLGVSTKFTDTVGGNIPVCLYNSDNVCARSWENTAISIITYLNSTVTKSVTNYYNISYSGSQFYGNVSKAGATVNTLIKFENENSTIYFSEPTLNTVSFNLPFLDYGAGLYINLTTSTGYTLKLINSSGVAGVVIPDIGSGGSASGQISYSASSIAVGQSYGINTSISDANFSTGRTYYIYAYDISDNLITGFPIEVTSQTYSSGKFWSFNAPGTYNATLKYCDNIVITCTLLGINRVEIDTAWAYVPVPTYAYSITTDKDSYTPGETAVFTISNPSPVKVYFDVFEDTIDTGLGVPTFGINTEIAAGSSISISKLVPDNMKLGNYTAYLVSAPLTEETINILTSKSFNISSPSSTSNTVFIGWDRDSYTLGDTGKLTTVSDYNATTVYVISPEGVNKTYLFPSNSTNITMVSFNEMGQWTAKLINNSGVVTYANNTVFAGAPIGNETFANCQFSKNYVCWDNFQYEQGDAYSISYRFDSSNLILINPYIQISNPNGESILNISINDNKTGSIFSGSVYGSFTPQATIGIYYVRIKNDNLNGNALVYAESATEVVQKTSVPTPTTDVETGTNNLLAGPFLTIIIVLLAFAGIGLELGGGIGSIMGFGSGFIVLSVIGLMPLWAIFLFSVIAITAFAVMAGKQFSGGGND